MSKRHTPVPDSPLPFGYKIAWYALATTDAHSVISALELQRPAASTWAQAIEAAYNGRVFVTPPVLNLTLATGISLATSLDNRPGKMVGPILRRLSKQFGDAQFFATHRVVEAHLWARAKKGRLLRGYCHVGDRMETTWNEGKPTDAERDAGIADSDSFFANEQTVMNVAKAWSVNPCEIDVLLTEPSLGLLCEAPAQRE